MEEKEIVIYSKTTSGKSERYIRNIRYKPKIHQKAYKNEHGFEFNCRLRKPRLLSNIDQQQPLEVEVEF